MNKATEEQVEVLKKLIKDKYFLLLRGGNGVGKTFLAKKVAEYLCKDGGKSEIVCLHKSFDYSDFVKGNKIGTDKNHLTFKNEDKVFNMLYKEAERNPKNNFVLILDEIQRVNLYSLFGDELRLLSSPALTNFFIIATQNTAVIADSTFDYSFYNNFFCYEVTSDYKFIEANTKQGTIDFTKFIYDKTNSIVRNYLNYSSSNWIQQYNTYKVGHGYFIGNLPLKLRYQIVPLLKEYIKNGVLLDYDGSLKTELESLLYESRDKIEMVDLEPDNLYSPEDENSPDPETLLGHHKYIYNILKETYDNKLLNIEDLFSSIIINENVFQRVSENSSIPYSAGLFTCEFRKKKFFRVMNVGKMNKGNSKGAESKEANRFYFNEESHILYKSSKYYYPASTYIDKDKIAENEIKKNKKGEEIVNTEDKEYNANILAAVNKNFTLNYLKYPILAEYLKKWIYLIETYGDKNQKGIINKFSSNRYIPNKLKELKTYRDDIINIFSQEKGVKRLMNEKSIIDIMENTGINQIILQGPPGTSKTYTAKEELNKKMNSEISLNDVRVEDFNNINDKKLSKIKKAGMCWSIIQFHPSYSYEDFVRGIFVDADETNHSIYYKPVNKILGQIAKFAQEHEQEQENIKCYLIIDEINRANVANVFGELIYALEYRGEEVSTPYTVDKCSAIKIPKNLYIIGTMNTADKSIGTLDYAIRRRFIFYPCLPNEDVIINYYEKKDEKLKDLALLFFRAVSSLFNIENGCLSTDYNPEDVQVGHTYFMTEKQNKLQYKFEYQVLPLLKEYFKDGVLEYRDDNEINPYAKLIMNYLKNNTGNIEILIKELKESNGN